MDLIQALAAELGKDPRHVENVVHLLDEGNTIPFIARYRKELHGAMDDTSLRTLEERLQYLRGLEERREAVKKSIDEQGKLNRSPRCSSRRSETARGPRRPRATLSTPKRASRRSRTPCRARATSSLSRSLTTPPSARAFARSFPVRASL